MNAYTINFGTICKLTDDQFYDLYRANPDLTFERNANGDLIIMLPTGGETGPSFHRLPQILFWS